MVFLLAIFDRDRVEADNAIEDDFPNGNIHMNVGSDDPEVENGMQGEI